MEPDSSLMLISRREPFNNHVPSIKTSFSFLKQRTKSNGSLLVIDVPSKEESKHAKTLAPLRSKSFSNVQHVETQQKNTSFRSTGTLSEMAQPSSLDSEWVSERTDDDLEVVRTKTTSGPKILSPIRAASYTDLNSQRFPWETATVNRTNPPSSSMVTLQRQIDHYDLTSEISPSSLRMKKNVIDILTKEDDDLFAIFSESVTTPAVKITVTKPDSPPTLWHLSPTGSQKVNLLAVPNFRTKKSDKEDKMAIEKKNIANIVKDINRFLK